MSRPDDEPTRSREHQQSAPFANDGSAITLTPSGAANEPSPFAPPTHPGELGRLGKYRIQKELGRGGMGAVFLAFDERLERNVALKVMLSTETDGSARTRFLREARAAAKIASDHVVAIYEADEIDGVPYISQQYLVGQPLDRLIDKYGTPTIQQIVRIARETALGLDAAHQLGLVHRDIKPANLWIEANGRVKILDFGLARHQQSNIQLTGSGMIVGTPAFMSPEQGRGSVVDGRSDLFSLGGVLYWLCTGQLPFRGDTTMALLMAIGIDDPKPVRELNSSVPESLEQLIRGLLAKDLAKRPFSARDVAEELAAISSTLETLGQLQANVAAAPEARVVPRESVLSQGAVRAPVAKNPVPMLLVALLLLAGVVVTAVVIYQTNDSQKNHPDAVAIPEKPEPKPIPTPTQKGDPEPKPTPTPKGDPEKIALPRSKLPDRIAAEHVLSIGGIVRINDQQNDITDQAELPPEDFSLTRVTLANSKRLTEAAFAHLKDCRDLAELALPGSSFSDEWLTHLKGCTNLTQILMQNTRVGDDGLANFKECKQLNHLALSHCPRITDAGMAHFKGFTQVRWLDIENTQIGDAGVANFKDCKELRSLLAHTDHVTAAGFANFRDCLELRTLSMGGPRITDEALAHFKDCTHLTVVNVRGSKLSDAGLVILQDKMELTNLDVQLSKVTAVGLRVLAKAVPGCRITHDGGVIEPKKQ